MTSFEGVRDLLAGAAGWIAGSGNLEIRDFPIEGFSSVQVSSAVQLQVSRGDSFKVSIEADDNLWSRLRVEKDGGTLRIGLEPGSTLRRMTLRAYVTMPALLGLKMSGASSGTISGFSSADAVALELTGASTLKGEIQSGDMTIDMGGASGVILTGSAGRLRFGASGGSQANLADMPAAQADVRVTGASKAILTGATEQLRIDAAGGSQASVTNVRVTEAEVRLSGASHVAVTGTAEQLRLDGSGGSQANLEDLQANDARVRLGGGSGASVHVTGRLDVSAGGASKLLYSGQPTMGRQHISGGSSIRPV